MTRYPQRLRGRGRCKGRTVPPTLKKFRHSWRSFTIARDNERPSQVLSKLFRPNLPLPERRRLCLANLDNGPVLHQRQRGCRVWHWAGKNEVVVAVYQDCRPYAFKPPGADQQPGNRLRNGRQLVLAQEPGSDIGSLPR